MTTKVRSIATPDLTMALAKTLVYRHGNDCAENILDPEYLHRRLREDCPSYSRYMNMRGAKRAILQEMVEYLVQLRLITGKEDK